MNDKKLSVTQLGRSLDTKAQEKNNIKRSDRFLGNRLVWQEPFSIYKEISLSPIGTNNRPLIIVDWSLIANFPRKRYGLYMSYVGSTSDLIKRV